MENITTIVNGIISAMGTFLQSLSPSGGGSAGMPAIGVVVAVTLAGGIARKAVGTVKRFAK